MSQPCGASTLDSSVHCSIARRQSATFRVSEIDSRSRTTILIDGDLVGDCVQIVEDCCDQAMSLGKRVHIFLRGALVVDEAGRALLRRLRANGARLHAIGIYTSYILETLNPARTKTPNVASGTRRPDRPPAKRS